MYCIVAILCIAAYQSLEINMTDVCVPPYPPMPVFKEDEIRTNGK